MWESCCRYGACTSPWHEPERAAIRGDTRAPSQICPAAHWDGGDACVLSCSVCPPLARCLSVRRWLHRAVTQGDREERSKVLCMQGASAQPAPRVCVHWLSAFCLQTPSLTFPSSLAQHERDRCRGQTTKRPRTDRRGDSRPSLADGSLLIVSASRLLCCLLCVLSALLVRLLRVNFLAQWSRVPSGIRSQGRGEERVRQHSTQHAACKHNTTRAQQCSETENRREQPQQRASTANTEDAPGDAQRETAKIRLPTRDSSLLLFVCCVCLLLPPFPRSPVQHCHRHPLHRRCRSRLREIRGQQDACLQ